MRYPEEHKQAVRAKIVEAASHALRRDGIDGVSIPALMKTVGLTHGAFYVHFADRDELVVEAARFAAERTATEVLAAQGGSVAQMLGTYLSSEHARHPEHGCVVAALGVEGGRRRGAIGAVFGELARGFVRHVHRRLHPTSDHRRVSDDTLELASRMVGAVVLARMVDEPALAERILTAARRPPSAKRGD